MNGAGVNSTDPNSTDLDSTEERLRAALRAHAEEFTTHPDAWPRLTARRRVVVGRAGHGGPGRPSSRWRPRPRCWP